MFLFQFSRMIHTDYLPLFFIQYVFFTVLCVTGDVNISFLNFFDMLLR